MRNACATILLVGITGCTDLPGALPAQEVTVDVQRPQAAEPLPVCGPERGEPCARVLKLAAGGTFTCAVLDDDTTRCWGDDAQGQLGAPAPTGFELGEVLVSDLPPFETMALGWHHGCGSYEGEVSCWGGNALQQRGAPGPSGPDVTRLELGEVHQLAASRTTTCALHDDPPQVSCWGFALDGQPWTDAQQGKSYPGPTPVPGLEDMRPTRVAVGRAHACAMGVDAVRCWGDDQLGQLGTDAAEDRSSAVDVARVYPLPVVDLIAGDDHTCLFADPQARAYCWGDLDRWFAFATPYVLYWWDGATAAKVTSGYRSLCVRYEEGYVRCSGDNQYGQLVAIPPDQAESRSMLMLVPEIEDAVQLVSGTQHLCALREDGSVWCWGRNTHGQLGRGFASLYEGPAPVEF